MSHDLEQTLRERLAEYADPVVVDEGWRRDVADRLEPVRLRHQRMRAAQAGIAVAAMVGLIVAGLALGRSPEAVQPAPAPQDTNREVIEQLPEGEAAGVLVVDEAGKAHLPDGTTVDVGNFTVTGHLGDQVLAHPPNDGDLVLLPSGRPIQIGTLSADGALSWNYDGTVVDVTTGEVVATTAPFPQDGRDYFGSWTTWTASGLVLQAVYNTDAPGDSGRLTMLLPSDPASAGRLAERWVEVDWPTAEDHRDPLFATESDRILFRHADACAYVARLDSRGALERVREICDEALGFSPDGSTVLTGAEGPFDGGVVDARSADALIDVDTGAVTELSSLDAIDDFDKNLLDVAWEDGDTVLLAFVVESLKGKRVEAGAGTSWVMPRAVVRLVRCRVAADCESVPGDIRTDTALNEVFGGWS